MNILGRGRGGMSRAEHDRGFNRDRGDSRHGAAEDEDSSNQTFVTQFAVGLATHIALLMQFSLLMLLQHF